MATVPRARRPHAFHLLAGELSPTELALTGASLATVLAFATEVATRLVTEQVSSSTADTVRPVKVAS